MTPAVILSVNIICTLLTTIEKILSSNMDVNSIKHEFLKIVDQYQPPSLSVLNARGCHEWDKYGRLRRDLEFVHQL